MSAIATPLAAGATGGISSPSLPSALGSLLGSVSLTPPLSFDDLRFPTTVGSPAFAGTYRRADAESMSPTGESIDLESGVHRPFIGGAPVPGFGDLVWAVAAGAMPGTRGAAHLRQRGLQRGVGDRRRERALRRLGALGAPDRDTDHASRRVAAGTGRDRRANERREAGEVRALAEPRRDTRTPLSRLGYARCSLPHPSGDDAMDATDHPRDPDTPGPIATISVKHQRFAHSATFDVQATRMSVPLQVSWRLGSAALTGAGSIVVDGVNVGFRRQASTVTLNVPLGAGLQAAPLTVEVTDADGRFVTDTRVLTVVGRRDKEYSPGIEDALARNLDLAQDAVMRFRQSWLREQVDLPPIEERLDLGGYSTGTELRSGSVGSRRAATQDRERTSRSARHFPRRHRGGRR